MHSTNDGRQDSRVVMGLYVSWQTQQYELDDSNKHSRIAMEFSILWQTRQLYLDVILEMMMADKTEGIGWHSGNYAGQDIKF